MKTIILILVILIQSVGVFSQTEKQIATSDSMVLQITNNISNYRKEIKNLNDSSKDITITYWLNKIAKYCTFSYEIIIC